MSKSLDRIVLGETEDFTKKPTKFKPPYMFIYASIINCWIKYGERMDRDGNPQGNNLYNIQFPSSHIKEWIFEEIYNEHWFMKSKFIGKKRVVAIIDENASLPKVTEEKLSPRSNMHFFNLPFSVVLDNALGTMVKLGYMSRERDQYPTERVVGIAYNYKIEQVPYEDLVKGIIANSQTAAESRAKQNDGTFPKLADLFQ
jgi:hypothetical protein